MSETAEVIVFDQNAGLGVDVGSVDVSAGTIKGVSIATAGVKAEGHEMVIVDENENVLETREWFTDEETLETMLEAIQEIGQPLKAKMEHGTGLTEIVGTFDNFRIDGKHLRADFTAIKSAASVGHLLELAQKVSKQFGVSVTANLMRVKAGAVDLMRAVKILSADFVDSPAINAGLFSSKNVVDKQLQQPNKRIQKPNTTMEDTLKEEVMSMIGEAVESKLSAYSEKLESVTDRLARLETPAGEMSEGQKEEMSAAIKASITELEGKLSDTTELEAKIKAEYEAKVSELSARVTAAEQLSTALGIGKRGASAGDGDTPEPKSFATELEAKIKAGTPYGKALHELKREQPEVVKAELARRGLNNINLI